MATSIGDSGPYSGEVTPGGPPDTRELAALVITKLAVDPEMSNNCYLLRCRATDEQVLIDAAAEPERLLELAGSTGVSRVITTHQHWDHHRALADLVAATGAVTVAGAPDAEAITEQTGVRVDDAVQHGDTVEFGDVRLEVIHLVGHTPGSIALLYDDPERHAPPVHRRLALPRRGRQHLRRRRRVPHPGRRGQHQGLRPTARRDLVLPRPRQRLGAGQRAPPPRRVAVAGLVGPGPAQCVRDPVPGTNGWKRATTASWSE